MVDRLVEDLPPPKQGSEGIQVPDIEAPVAGEDDSLPQSFSLSVRGSPKDISEDRDLGFEDDDEVDSVVSVLSVGSVGSVESVPTPPEVRASREREGEAQEKLAMKRYELREKVSDACLKGDATALRHLLGECVRFNFLDIAQRDAPESFSDFLSILNYACNHFNPRCLRMLLSFPGTNVNVESGEKDPALPLGWCCSERRLDSLKVLVRDSHTRADIGFLKSPTPLWQASSRSDLRVIEVLIASGKYLNFGARAFSDNCDVDALDLVREDLAFMKRDNIWVGKVRSQELQKRTQCVELLTAYKTDQETTTAKMRREVGFDDLDCADLFALVVFLCDGLLQLRDAPASSPSSTATSSEIPSVSFTAKDTPPFGNARRFFGIAAKLPLELQMVLCRRAFNLAKDSISPTESGTAFTMLADTLLCDEEWQLTKE